MKKWIGALSLLLPSLAYAEPDMEFRATAGTQLNPLGAVIAVDGTFSWKIYDSDNPLLAKNHISTGFVNRFTPAGDFLNLFVEVSPASILDLRFAAVPFVYTGIFGSGLGFADYNTDYSEAFIDTREEVEDGINLAGGYLAASQTVKLKAGPVIASFTSNFEFWKAFNADQMPDGTFFWDAARHVLIDGNGDVLFNTNAILGPQLNFGKTTLLVAANHTFQTIPGGDNDSQRHMLGVVASLTLGNVSWKPEILARGAFYAADSDFAGTEGTAFASVGFRGTLFSNIKPPPPPPVPNEPETPGDPDSEDGETQPEPPAEGIR